MAGMVVTGPGWAQERRCLVHKKYTRWAISAIALSLDGHLDLHGGRGLATVLREGSTGRVHGLVDVHIEDCHREARALYRNNGGLLGSCGDVLISYTTARYSCPGTLVRSLNLLQTAELDLIIDRNEKIYDKRSFSVVELFLLTRCCAQAQMTQQFILPFCWSRHGCRECRRPIY